MDKSWKEDVDYEKAEDSLVCKDGDSIQGSHIALYTAWYVLQWKYPSIVSQISLESTGGVGGGVANDQTRSTSSHKPQVMYFYEVLRPAAYK